MHWLFTLKYSCFTWVCPFVRMLCDIETSYTANDMETGGIYWSKSKSWSTIWKPSFLWSTTRSPKSPATRISLFCHLHSSARTVPRNSCSRKLVFSLSKYLYTYFTFHKNNIKKEQIHIRFRKQTVLYSVSIVLLLHRTRVLLHKNSAILLLAKFQPNYL